MELSAIAGVYLQQYIPIQPVSPIKYEGKSKSDTVTLSEEAIKMRKESQSVQDKQPESLPLEKQLNTIDKLI